KRFVENSAAVNGFIQAIANDSSYGVEYAKIAHKELSGRTAKPFTGKDISRIMNQIDATRTKDNKVNELKNNLQVEVRMNAHDTETPSLKEGEAGFCKVFINDANRGQVGRIAGEPTNRDNWREPMNKLFTDEHGNFNRELCLMASKIMQQGTFEPFMKAPFIAVISAGCDNLITMDNHFEITKSADGNYHIEADFKCVMQSTSISEGYDEIAMLKAGMPVYSASAEIILPANGNPDEVVIQSFSHSLSVKNSSSDEAKEYAKKFVEELPVSVNNDYPRV
ncbi:MAG: hypothetical protein LBI37_02360, partial [Puniceicoccales bacterium]|nr:hypothetical protein [Puniceicoccales bacterium]